MKTKMLAVMALGLITAACGTDPQERTTGGAAAGAATGAAVGALGGPAGMLAGAAIGGGAGAVTGAVTDPRDVNLGEPPWSNPEARVPGVTSRSSRSASTATSDPRTRQLQQALNSRGYNAGPADGIYGARTRQAVMDWQRANNMSATGTPDSRMLSELNVTSSGSMATGSGMRSGDRATGGTGMTPGTDSGGRSLSRPDPMAPGQVQRAPSNNPMNDPIGGGATSGMLNNNQNTNEGSSGSGSTR